MRANMDTDTGGNADAAPASSLSPKWMFAGGAVIAGFLVASGDGRFIPTDTAITSGLGLGILGAAAGALLTNALQQRQDGNATARTMLALVASFFVFGFMGASIGIIALPDLYTRSYGVPATRQETALQWLPRSRHTCSGVAIPELPFWFETLCLPRYAAPGTVLTLHGQQSSLGFHVSRIDY